MNFLQIEGKSIHPHTNQPQKQPHLKSINQLSYSSIPSKDFTPVVSTSFVNFYEQSEFLTGLEKSEISEYPQIWYYGQNCPDKKASTEDYDDARGDYILVKGDQIAFRYEIQETLGKGSFGQVVACFDHLTDTKVALKIIRNKKRFHQQALIEVKILEHLKREGARNHSIVEIESSFYFRNHLCIVFPLLSLNLYEFIKQNNFNGFSMPLIRRILSQILDSLCLLDNLDIIHCDLKPENILLTYANKSSIKVIDFGSSCYVNEKIYTYIQSRFYRCPEIVLGLEYGKAIDMWSLGCILAELFTGYPIFPAQDEQELMSCFMEILGSPPRDLVDRCTRRKIFFHSNGSPRIIPNSKGKTRAIGTRTLFDFLKPEFLPVDPNFFTFVDFIGRCLVWDPSQRMTAHEAKNHPFLGIESSLASINIATPKKSYLPPINANSSLTRKTNPPFVFDAQSSAPPPPSTHTQKNQPYSSFSSRRYSNTGSSGGMIGQTSKYKVSEYSSYGGAHFQSTSQTQQQDGNDSKHGNGWSTFWNSNLSKLVNGIKGLGSSKDNLLLRPNENPADSDLMGVTIENYRQSSRQAKLP